MSNSLASPHVQILVVDDDPDVRVVLAETLVELGYGVQQAVSGEAALAILERNSAIDMMITDIRMPGMSGIELAEKARSRNDRLKVILISGYFVPQALSQPVLKKPFHMEELATAVNAALG